MGGPKPLARWIRSKWSRSKDHSAFVDYQNLSLTTDALSDSPTSSLSTPPPKDAARDYSNNGVGDSHASCEGSVGQKTPTLDDDDGSVNSMPPTTGRSFTVSIIATTSNHADDNTATAFKPINREEDQCLQIFHDSVSICTDSRVPEEKRGERVHHSKTTMWERLESFFFSCSCAEEEAVMYNESDTTFDSGTMDSRSLLL